MIVALCCTIAGSVRSASGAPVAGSRIVVDGAAAVAATTDADGDFVLAEPPGPHRVSATARGYAPLTIAVNGNRDVHVTFALTAELCDALEEAGEYDEVVSLA